MASQALPHGRECLMAGWREKSRERQRFGSVTDAAQ
jgi:hypothetical protein